MSISRKEKQLLGKHRNSFSIEKDFGDAQKIENYLASSISYPKLFINFLSIIFRFLPEIAFKSNIVPQTERLKQRKL